MDCTYGQIAKRIDRSLLNPALTDEEMEAGCGELGAGFVKTSTGYGRS